MPFISSSEAKNTYFMSGEATNEIYIFASRDENKWHIHSKNLNFLFIIYHFKRNNFFSLNDVIHVRTLRHISDDVALCTMTVKTETEKKNKSRSKKVKISANPGYLITKILLAILLRK